MEEVKYHIPPKRDEIGEDVRFKIIVPFFNGQKYLQKCLESIENQTYKNYDVVVIDDASNELGIKSYALEMCRKNNWKIIFNNINKGALENIVNAISFLRPKDENVIVTIDGDDWLKNNEVFSLLNSYYKINDILMTFGSHEHHPTGEYGLNNGNPESWVVDSSEYRKTRWMYSHLRTFKYSLWKNIKNHDLRDVDGKYFKMAWDLAFMIPMLEMSGNKICHIPDVLYVYNMETPLNDHKKNARLQAEYDMFIRSKPKYSRL